MVLCMSRDEYNLVFFVPAYWGRQGYRNISGLGLQLKQFHRKMQLRGTCGHFEMFSWKPSSYFYREILLCHWVRYFQSVVKSSIAYFQFELQDKSWTLYLKTSY